MNQEVWKPMNNIKQLDKVTKTTQVRCEKCMEFTERESHNLFMKCILINSQLKENFIYVHNNI